MRKRKLTTSKKTITESKKKSQNCKKRLISNDLESLLTCTFVKTLLQNDELEVSFRVQSVVGEDVFRLFDDGVVKLEDVSTSLRTTKGPCKCSGCGGSAFVPKKVLSFSLSVDKETYKCSACLPVTQTAENCDLQENKTVTDIGDDIPLESSDKDEKLKDDASNVEAESVNSLSKSQGTKAETNQTQIESENNISIDRVCKLRSWKQNEVVVKDVNSDGEVGDSKFEKDNETSHDVKVSVPEEDEQEQKSREERNKNNSNHKSPHICDICGKQLLNLKTLKSHKSTHVAGPAHICNICNRSFSHIRYLKKHEKTHIKEKPYICEVCGQRFKLKESLPKHMVLHGDKKPFQCDICHKQFHLEEQMKKHATIHTEERKFICELCGKRFRTQGSMKSHKDTHEGPMKHSCEQCGKSYRSAWYLKIHQKTHTGQNLIQCKDCNDWFIDPCYFKLHQRKFCKGKPLLCSECGLELPHNQALQSHMGLHTGERPHGCKMCGKAFAKPSLLTEHMKRHTLQNCLTCRYCKKGFINNKELKRHERCHINKKKKACLPESLKPGRAEHELDVQKEVDKAHLELRVEDAQTATGISHFLHGTEYVQTVSATEDTVLVVASSDDTVLPPVGETISVSCIRYVSDAVVDHGSAAFQQTSDAVNQLNDADHTGASTQVLSSRGGHITVHDPISITHMYSSSGQVPGSQSIQFSPPSFHIPNPPPTEIPQSSIISTPEGEQLQQLQPITTSNSVSLAYENETSVQHLLQAAAIIKDYPAQY